MAGTSRYLYEFASFRLDPAERRLLRDGEPVALTPKCFDLLVVLVESGGHLLEKSDLMARVWPDQFVEEGSLSFNISELRKALGEGQNGQQYIETVRKKGFRFVAPVAEIPVGENAVASGEVATSRGELPSAIETTPHSSRRFAIVLALVAAAAITSLAYFLWPRPAVAPLEGPPRTIAVLPFKPLAANVRDEPLELGICDALITRLAGLDQLVVRPTSAVVSYNRLGQDPLAAGRELGVDALLEGYIQRSHGRVRVTARLLRTADGKSLWSGQFNEKFTDIFTVEDSISRQIAEALQLNISGDEQKRVTKHSTENVDAYELYLKGYYFQEKRTPDGVARSIDYFQQATAKDPRYALAFAALANSYVVLAIRADMPPKDSYQKAKAAALRALEIDSANAQAHSALANVKSWYDWDWPAAEREFQRAIALSPNDPTTRQQYASFLIVMGRHAEAIEQILRAERVAPVSMHISVQVARILFFARQTDAAMEQCRKSLEMDDTFGGAHLFLGRIYTQKHMYREAHTELERGRALLPNSAEVLSLIGYTYAVSGRAGEAQQVLEELQRLSRLKYVSPYHIAMVYAGLGKKDDAFQWLEKAYDEREGRMTLLRFAPEFAPLRSDPRFTQLLQRMKLI